MQKIAIGAVALVSALALAACGGGGGTGTTPPVATKATPTPTPSPTPTPTPTPPPPTTTQSGTVSASGTQVQLDPINTGVSASLSLPGATSGAGATISASLSAGPPPNVTAPQRRRATANTHTGVAYLSLTTNQDVTLSGSVSITFHTGTGTQQYFLAGYFGQLGWLYDALGPAAPDSSGNVTFTTPSQSTTIPANTTIVFALTIDTPGTLTVSPQSLTFSSIGAGSGQALYPQEQGYGAQFQGTSADSNVVKVQQGDAGSLWVTPVGAGTTTITVTDVYGQTVSVPVTVTSTPVTIQKAGR